ncbi:MAG TPA: ABC transporter permease subunit [Candidatus Eisenbacteria bacterium]
MSAGAGGLAPRRPRAGRAGAARIAARAWTASLAFLLVTPLLVTAWGAFSRSEWYGRRSEGAAVAGAGTLFHYVWSTWGSALLLSASLVAVVVPIALLIGVPAAIAFERRPFRGSSWLEAATLSILSVPGIALSVALLFAAGGSPRFWLLVAGHLAYTVPLVVRTVRHALALIDPRLEDAGRTLGAPPGRVARRILLPMLRPSVTLAALLVFTVSWGEFNASYLLTTPLVQTFPAALFATYTTNSFPVAAAATVIFLLPVVPALLAIQALGGEALTRGLQA